MFFPSLIFIVIVLFSVALFSVSSSEDGVTKTIYGLTFATGSNSCWLVYARSSPFRLPFRLTFAHDFCTRSKTSSLSLSLYLILYCAPDRYFLLRRKCKFEFPSSFFFFSFLSLSRISFHLRPSPGEHNRRRWRLFILFHGCRLLIFHVVYAEIMPRQKKSKKMFKSWGLCPGSNVIAVLSRCLTWRGQLQRSLFTY